MKVRVEEGVLVDVDTGVVGVLVDITETQRTMTTLSATAGILVVKVPLKSQTLRDLMTGVVATADLVVVSVVVAVVVLVTEKRGMGTVLAGYLNAAVGWAAGKYSLPVSSF